MTQGSGQGSGGWQRLPDRRRHPARAAALFIFQNTADTTFKFLFWSFTFPLWLGLLITALVAFVVGQFALMWRRHKRRQARRDAR